MRYASAAPAAKSRPALRRPRAGAVNAAACAALFVPFPPDIRLAVCVVLMAPSASVAPLLTKNAGGDGARAAQINSVSILMGIAMMMGIYLLMS